ncbi:MAG: AsmA family protein [Geminicoccaceae bacterium]|nr:AsmA family protein [Geminicoccaceae bacterium]
MRKLLWWVLAAVLVLPAVLAFLLVLMPFTLLKWPAAAAIGAALDRKVTIGGPIDVDLFNPTRLVAEGVRVANADWAGDRPFLALGKVALELDTAKLGDGVLVVRRLSLDAPELNLARNAAGAWNWPSVGGAEPTPTGDHPPPASPSKWRFLVERLDIAGGALTYDEPGRAQPRRFAPIDLDVRRVPDGEALDVKGRIVGATGPATIEGRVEDMAALEAGKGSPLRLRLEAPGGRLGVEGRIGGETPLDLRLAAHVDRPGTLARWAGDGVAMPREMPDAIDLKAGLIGDFGAVALRGLDLETGGLAVKGDLALDLDPAERPRVTGALDLGRIEALSDGAFATPGATPRGERPDAKEGWPTDPVDWPVPLPLDLDLNLVYARLGLGGIGIENGTGHLYADSLITRLEIAGADALGGGLDAEASLRREGAGPPKLGFVLDGKGLSLGPLLAALGARGLEGKVDLALDLAASGASIDEAVRGLNGTGRLRLEEGRIADAAAFDTALSLLAGETTRGDAPIQAATGLGVENGVAHTDGLAGTFAGLDVAGEGTVDLPERRLALRLDPTTSKGQSPPSVAGDGSPLGRLFGGGGILGLGLFKDVRLVVEGPWRDLACRVAVDGETSGDLRDPKAAAAFAAGLVARDPVRRRLGGTDRVGGALAKTLGEAAAKRLGEDLGKALGAGAAPLVDRLLGSGRP